MSNKAKSWESRLSGGPDKLTVAFVESLSIDKRLYRYDIAGSIEHAKMLSERKLISKAEFSKIKKGLVEIGRQIEEGKFRFDNRQEDIHMAIEAALIKTIGDAGRKLHTGRSRNDQVATDIRLWMKDEVDILQREIRELQSALLQQAGKYVDGLMPGYTHLQQAQPISIGGYLLSFVERFERDSVRLNNCVKLADVSPLGSGAIAGSTLGLERRETAKRLGFAGISRNSIDAVSDRDFCAEFIFDCAMIASHLSQLAEDLVVYSSNEFAFIRIADSFCTSSSMMPQKRNPDVLELIRGRTGRVYGALVGMLSVLKAQPTGYNRDLQEDKIHLFTAADTIRQSLPLAEQVVLNTEFELETIAEGMEAGFCDATSLAEYLVAKGMPFRPAHSAVGKLVSYCERKGCKLSELTLDELSRYCPAAERDVYKALGAANVAGRYKTTGSAGPRDIKKQIRYWKKRLGDR